MKLRGGAPGMWMMKDCHGGFAALLHHCTDFSEGVNGGQLDAVCCLFQIHDPPPPPVLLENYGGVQ